MKEEEEIVGGHFNSFEELQPLPLIDCAKA